MNSDDKVPQEQANYTRILGGLCFAHGTFVGEHCPQWPKCATDQQVYKDGLIPDGVGEQAKPTQDFHCRHCGEPQPKSGWCKDCFLAILDKTSDCHNGKCSHSSGGSRPSPNWVERVADKVDQQYAEIPEWKKGRPSPEPSGICPSCQATDNNSYVDANGVAIRACGRCMIQWRDVSAIQPSARTAPEELRLKFQEVAIEILDNCAEKYCYADGQSAVSLIVEQATDFIDRFAVSVLQEAQPQSRDSIIEECGRESCRNCNDKAMQLKFVEGQRLWVHTFTVDGRNRNLPCNANRLRLMKLEPAQQPPQGEATK